MTTAKHSKHTRLNFQRFEFKYILPIQLADKMIPDLLVHMKWDPFVEEQGTYYQVNSLYYDTDGFQCFHEKQNGVKRRKKLRLRIYDTVLKPESRVYLEIKRKHDMVCLKDRLEIDFETLQNAIKNNNYTPFLKNGLSHSEKKVMEEFLWTQYRFQMKPKLLVKYIRRPLVAKINQYFRVTFDSQIKSLLTDSLDPNQEMGDVYPEQLVLEVKFNNSLPHWFYQIIQKFDLHRSSFSKYCEGLICCKPNSKYIFTL